MEDRLDNNNAVTIAWLFSPIAFVNIICMGMYDILMLVLVIEAIYRLINGRKWLLCFALAIPLKMFAFLLFLPILLVYEKRIIRILLDIACVLIPYVACTMLYRVFDGTALALSSQEQGELIGKAFAIRVDFSVNQVSVFAVLYIVLLLVCFFCGNKKDKSAPVICATCNNSHLPFLSHC